MNPLSIQITELDKPAQIVALKALVNSCLARAIGSVRQHLRNEKREERNATEEKFVPPDLDSNGVPFNETGRRDRNIEQHTTSSLDERNNRDEDSRPTPFPEGQDSEQPLTPMMRAEILMTIYEWSCEVLRNLSLNKYDQPNTVDGMLKLMLNGAPKGMTDEMIDGLAEHLEVSRETIQLTREAKARNDKAELLTQIPEIRNHLNGTVEFNEKQNLDTADRVLQHQLAVVITKAMLWDISSKNEKGTLTRIINSGNLGMLGNITFIKEGIKQMTKWVNAAEVKFRTELNEAMESGRTINTLD